MNERRFARILVVDDSATEIFHLSEILIGEGYHVVTAANGQEAIDKAKRDLPDLILMDVVMPGMNGYQATRELRRDEATRHIPVILCTTKGEDADKIWGMRQGAQDYLIKPVDAELLLDAIERLNT